MLQIGPLTIVNTVVTTGVVMLIFLLARSLPIHSKLYIFPHIWRDSELSDRMRNQVLNQRGVVRV